MILKNIEYSIMNSCINLSTKTSFLRNCVEAGSGRDQININSKIYSFDSYIITKRAEWNKILLSWHDPLPFCYNIRKHNDNSGIRKLP